SFPVRDTFDKLFPGRPMYLSRIDGHAALVNQDALGQAKFDQTSKINGGDLLKDAKGNLTGVIMDNAADSVQKLITKPTRNQQIEALKKAQQDCFGVGLTTVDDAGLDKQVVLLIDSLQKANALQMRVYSMLNPTEENFEAFLRKGIYVTDKLSVRSFKIYSDGALGSRGACLLKPYSDKPETNGFLISPPKYFRDIAAKIGVTNFQMNTHCIGDSANRWLLKTYGEVLKGKNDRRWRIEHAQIVDPADFSYFRLYNIIPSVQPTHATSDMYWAMDRLGKNRLTDSNSYKQGISGAYAYKQLLKNASILAGGSDFPVEGINPLLGFYAAVSRQDAKGFPKNGFQMQDALTREEALRSMTIWAAYSNFEEKQKGSIEKGKMADFAILEKDIMKIDLPEILQTKVLKTYIGGKMVYKAQ
ncbi:MAG: amidohydrolase, partial [Sphingobacteriales bacterium]